MIKPDYIEFSQEIFDDIEQLRLRLLEDASFSSTVEYRAEAVRLQDYVFDRGYGKYLDLIQSKR